MPNLKSLLMLLAITMVAAGATVYIKYQIDQIYFFTANVAETLPSITVPPVTVVDESVVPVIPPVLSPTPKPPVTPPQGIAVSLSGKLTEVNTGCFADGECYAVVDGKKVILLIGWYQGLVGKILGAESIGDLEAFIGTEATVFAGQDDDGNYTLLGNESFYLKVSSPSEPVTAGSCVVGGCSAQLCGEKSEMEGMATTCEYREQYACYQKATCERQVTGKCGWTETPGLAMCLKDNS